MFSQLYVSDVPPFESFDLIRALQVNPDHVRSEILKSKLEDRGVYKRNFSSNFDCHNFYKVLVVNVAECFFCASKDAFLLHKYPRTILEGAILAATALNVSEVCLVVHGALLEHYENLAKVRDQAMALNVIGVNSPLRLQVRVRLSNGTLSGAHARAVLRHLEGKRAVNYGPPSLFGENALVCNAESIFCVPTICSKGAEWWLENEPHIVMMQGYSLQEKILVSGAQDRMRTIIEEGWAPNDLWGDVKCVFPGGLFSKPLTGAFLENAVMCSSYMSQRQTTMSSGNLIVVLQNDPLMELFLRFIRSAVTERNMCCVGCREGLPLVQEALECDDLKKAVYASKQASLSCECTYSSLVVTGLLASLDMGVL